MKKATTITAAVMAGLLGFAGVAGALPTIYTPSMTIEQLNSVSTVESSSTTEGGTAESANETAMDTSTSNPKVRKAAENATKFFDENADALDEETNAKIFAVLGDDVDTATCAEAGPLVLKELKDDGHVDFKLQLASSYKVGDYVAVLVGIEDADGNITYIVVKGQINDDKGVIFTLDHDVAQKLVDGTGFYAIYSAESTLLG
jgi:nucleoside 2-deoxyribosyltransferase